MAHEQAMIEMPEGRCRAHVFTPAGKGPWPPIIVYMDAFALRPALFELGQRLANAGYVVLLPDLFYRFGRYDPLVPKELFAADWRAVVGPMTATTDNYKAADDTGTFLDYLDGRADVARLKVGVVGFCMGGGMALAAAGRFPDRIAAVASFHGGRLATDTPTSPHLMLPNVKAEVYIAGADNDASYPRR